MIKSGRLLLCLSVLCAGHALRAQSLITEFPMPTAAAGPDGITLGPDGNLWITEISANRIAKVTTAGAVTEIPIPTPACFPVWITSGPDGNLWFTELTANKIGRITTAGAITEFTLAAPFLQPQAIVSGPGGKLWFVDMAGHLGSMNTAGTVVDQFIIPIAWSNLRSGPDGNLWVTDIVGSNLIRITPGGTVTQFPFSSNGNPISNSPGGMAFGPDGKLWFAGNGIWTITTAGGMTRRRIPFETPSGMTFGPDNNLWFTESSSGKIGRVRADGVMTEYQVPSAAAYPYLITTGPDGNLWFTERDANKIAKVTMASVPAINPPTLGQSALTFSASITGSAPAAQTLSVGAPATAFNASVSTDATPSWLSITPSGNLTGNQNLSVTAARGALGGGFYDGTVFLTSGNVIQGVPVTLQVVDPTAVNLTVSPTSLNFSYTTGGAVPPAVSLGVTNAASVFFTMTTSVASPSGGHWLKVSAGGAPVASGTRGSTPGSFSVTFDPAGLGAGPYRANITIAPDVGTSTTIPVSLTVTSPPTTVTPSPTSLAFTMQAGGSAPAQQTLQMTQSGPSVAYSIGTGGSTWLQVTPQAGLGPGFLTVSVASSASSFAAGTYSATLTITLAGGNSASVPVQLTVTPAPTPAPTFSASPASLSFTIPSGGTPPLSQALQFTQTGTPAAAFTVSTNGSTWLQASPLSGQGSTAITVSVAASASNLAAGSYSANLTINPTGATAISVPVQLTVTSAAATFSVSPASLSFTVQSGGTPPASQALQFNQTGTPAAAFTVSTNGSAWLQATPLSGQGSAAITVSVAASASSLATGSYSANLTINPTGGTAITVPVQLTVTSFSLSPASLNFTYQTGGTLPGAQSIQLTQPGTGAAFTVNTNGSAWLQATPLTGQGSAAISVSVGVGAAILSPGTYNANLTIAVGSAPAASVPVKLTVTTATSLSAAPTSLTFAAQAGATPPAQTAQVTQTGQSQAFSVSTGGSGWLQVTPQFGVGSAALTVSVTPPGAGTYHETIHVSLPGQTGTTLDIPVTLTVAPASTGPSVVQEYTLPNTGSQPGFIAQGADNNLWFTEPGGNRIGRITSGGAIVEYVLPSAGSRPYGIANGPDGNLWFTETVGNRIGKINTAGAIAEFAIPTAGASPWGIALGPDRNLWFTESAGNRIGRITAAGAITEFTIPTAGAQPEGIALGPDNNLWFAETGANKIGRITPAGAITEFALPAGGRPAFLGSGRGGDKSVWFSESAASRIGKIAADGTVSEYLVPSAYGTAGDLTAQSGGLWFTLPTTGKIGLMAGDTTLALYDLPAADSHPFSIVQGADGDFWFTEFDGNRIGRLPQSKVTQPKLLGLDKTALAFSGFAGGSAAPQTITVSGNGTASYTAIAEVLSGEKSWLSVTPTGTLSGRQAVSVSVDLTGLAQGAYSGVVYVSSGSVVQYVPVTLTVTTATPGLVSALPGALSFVHVMKTNAPAAGQTLTIGNPSGAGSVVFSISTDGGDWLKVGALQGSTPMPLAVTYDPSGLAPGVYHATVTIRPLAGGALTIPVKLTVVRVVSAASFADGSISPGEIVTIAGAGLGPASPQGLALDDSGRVASQLGGLRVLFNGVPAPLIYASADQINCIVPYEAAGAVVTARIDYGGDSISFALNGTAAAPAIFTATGTGTGAVAALNTTGGYNGPDNAAPAGSGIVFYLTGEGQTAPGGVTGSVTAADGSGGPLTPQPKLPLTVTIGGQTANVTFYGEAPGLVAGVMQVNVEIPQSAPAGSLPLVVTLGDSRTQSGVTVAVR